MEFDQVPGTSQPAPVHLATATDRALDVALQPGGGTHRHLELQRAMRALCAEARRQGVRAEELIVLFKKTWQARPEVHTMSREDTGRFLEAVVTMCVEEYYDPR